MNPNTNQKMMKNKSIVLLQHGRNLLVCSFNTDHTYDDPLEGFEDDAMFHFQERIGLPERHADFIIPNYFDKPSDDEWKILQFIDLSEKD